MNRSLRSTVACSLTALAAATALAACSGSTGSSSSTRPATSAAAAHAPSATYATKHFTTPVDVDVPSWLDPTPTEDTAHFVTFESSDGSRALRILSPVVVYPPGSTTTADVPTDYLSYLLDQAGNGAKFSGRVDTTVDGRRATVLTARTDQSIDGGLGCPGTGISAEDCFGLQADLVLRLAVVSTDSGPLLIWLRDDVSDNPDPTAEARRFDQFLSGVRFSDRTS
jgi:hypothetical protein